MLKVAHEQIGIGRGHTVAHGRAFDLEVMMGVEGEVVMDKDKLCGLVEEMSGWLGVDRVLVQEMFQGREIMGMGDVGV